MKQQQAHSPRSRTMAERIGASDPVYDTSIFTALQEQVGLKLEATKGLGDFLVIDHIEHPSEKLNPFSTMKCLPNWLSACPIAGPPGDSY